MALCCCVVFCIALSCLVLYDNAFHVLLGGAASFVFLLRCKVWVHIVCVLCNRVAIYGVVCSCVVLN